MTTPPSTDLRNQLQGLWLPLVTPFDNGALDEASLRRLVRHYARQPIDGLILAATSGEGMTLERAELEQIVTLVRSGLSGSGAPCRSAWDCRAPARHTCSICSMKPRRGQSTAT